VRAILVVGVGLLGGGGVLGCGDEGGLSDDTVAEVGDSVITESDFERALSARSGRHNPASRDHDACVARKEREARAASEDGGATPARALLERECREEYKELKSDVVKDLIEDEWIRQEAEARDIVVTDAAVQRAIDNAREDGFLAEGALKRSGRTLEQLLPHVRETQLRRKVTEHLTGPAGEVSAKEVVAYYRQNKAELIVQERRTVRLVLTKSRARAGAARAALQGGRDWASVAKDYSLHASRDTGGRVADIRKGPLQTPLVTSVFEARKGQLTGPIKADESSWAVLVVERIKPAFQATLERARDDIKEFLVSTRRREALAAFTRRYRGKTTCAPGFRIPLCKNSPKRAEGTSGT
jgi:foldase protein PrsA